MHEFDALDYLRLAFIVGVARDAGLYDSMYPPDVLETLCLKWLGYIRDDRHLARAVQFGIALAHRELGRLPLSEPKRSALWVLFRADLQQRYGIEPNYYSEERKNDAHTTSTDTTVDSEEPLERGG